MTGDKVTTSRAAKTTGKRKIPARKLATRKAAKKPAGRCPRGGAMRAKRRSPRRDRSWLALAGLGFGPLAIVTLAALTLSWPDGAVQVAERQVATMPSVKTELQPQAVPATPAPAKAAEPPPVAPTAEQQTVDLPPPAAETPAWRRFAASHEAKPGQPRIAVVLDDIGPGKTRSRNAIQLPSPLTLAFLPYAGDLVSMTRQARAQGHELLVHIPMEPKDLAHNDPGKNALLLSLSDANLRQRLEWALDRFSGYVGINNHMGSAFTANRKNMDLVMERLGERGALFLDSLTNAASQGEAAARAAGIPTISRDIFLDHYGDDPGMVLQQLAKAEALAERQGHAVAIGHPYDGTLTALELWIPDARARGFALVPISALVEEPATPG